ncbi:hypothetical protein A4A49_24978 [Nicotiana attenuata]|uniref:Uncharacterized protein n=1 Tax=Nicotiana attenuata TaxID=49451 RepID=A0A1J6KFW0_NICAT|nr:hypothetical protein A4A49_24978 [Nicotiana attenuata]
MPLTSACPKRIVIAAKEINVGKKKTSKTQKVVIVVQSVDSPSRTLTAQNKKANNVGALQRVRPQDSGESVAGPNPQKLSSTAKADQEATSISHDEIRAKLGSDLHERPTIAASVFDGKKVVLDIRKEFILKLWTSIQRKLKGSTVDNVFNLEENTKVILEAMGGDDVDIPL